MRETTAIVVRPSASLERAAAYRTRLQQSDEQLRYAFAKFRTAVQAVTPAAQVSENPVQWVLGGLALGILIGWLSGSPKSRRLT